jgi:hypothetical protein
MSTTLILSETSIDYLHFIDGRRPEIWVVGIIVISAALVILVDFRHLRPDPDFRRADGRLDRDLLFGGQHRVGRGQQRRVRPLEATRFGQSVQHDEPQYPGAVLLVAGHVLQQVR